MWRNPLAIQNSSHMDPSNSLVTKPALMDGDGESFSPRGCKWEINLFRWINGDAFPIPVFRGKPVKLACIDVFV
jgi:hypothetical protein